MAMLCSCGQGSGVARTLLKAGPDTLQSGALQITTSTTLFPEFDPNITDYVSASSGSSPYSVSVTAPANAQVSVDGHPYRTQAFTTPVSVAPGQAFTFLVNSQGTTKTYHVRCLPADFPTWTIERPGTPQAEYYVVTPNIPLKPGDSTRRNYVILADGQGVPIWWYRSTDAPVDALLLPNNNMAWLTAVSGEERRLDGSLVRTLVPVRSIYGNLDTHELLLLPNGNYLFIVDVVREHVDLSPYGGSANAKVADMVIEEVSPSNTLIWQWSAMDHLSLSETDPAWRPKYIGNADPADPYHMNSVEWDGSGLVISFRHLNAVIRIDRTSGNIVWKLGGSQRPESLTFSGDPYGNFGGQHDARILADGTLTVHDDGGNQGRPPRAVRYRLDTVARTATFVEQVTDPDVAASGCCGSARKVTGGDWVMSWGQNPVVTELSPAGQRVFRMTFQEPYFSYRAQPVPFGMISRTALRSGMDAQFPR